MASTLAAAAATFGLASPSGAQTGSVPGVTANSVTLGFIYDKGGVAGSTFQHAGDACQARVAAENAKGGVNGRKINLEAIDDSGSENNLAAAQDLVQRRNVFGVVDYSVFTFTAYRYLLDAGVPTIGGGFDGTEYGQPGNENLISAGGNQGAAQGVVYTNLQTLLKKFKAKNVGAAGYGISPSSTKSVQNFQNYVVKGAGLNPAYTNTSVDFGTTDVGPIVLGMKSANVDSIYLSMVASTDFAILQQARQNDLNLKLAILLTGYGQPLLDDPVVQILGPNDLFAAPGAPVELKTAATKQFQADLKKYAGYTGVPDVGVYGGYTSCDLAIAGLKAAGKDLTRQGYLDAIRGLKGYNSAGLACQPLDFSKEGYGKAAPTSCSYWVYVKNGKFVVFNNGKPIKGTLIGASAVAAPSSS